MTAPTDLRADGSRRRWAGPLVVGTVVTSWVVAVLLGGWASRVSDNVGAALTMVGGSFVAGSTPQGGGAVAFPVLTKGFGVSAADARTFSLSIQAIGMGSAAAVLLLGGARLDRRALRTTIPWALAGFGGGAALFAMAGPPSGYVKVGFTSLIALTGATTWLAHRRGASGHDRGMRGSPHRMLASAAFAGGVVSSLVGSGADVAVFLVLTIACGVGPRIGVATSVVTMAVVSVAGLAVFGLVGGGLTAVTQDGSDLFGMWLAAVPVVAIGAPLGSWAAQRVRQSWLVGFIVSLAAVEIATTAVFVEELRGDVRLVGFAIAGLSVAGLLAAALVRSGDIQTAEFALPPPVAGTARSGPEVDDRLRGVRSVAGAVNAPTARFCRRTGLRMAAVPDPCITDERPPLAVVVLDDGTSFSLDRDVVFGRMPTLDPRVQAQRAVPRVVDDDGVSRCHLWLRTHGWDVEAVDLGAHNGTYLRTVGGGWEVLRPGMGRRLTTGSELRLGERTFSLHLIGR